MMNRNANKSIAGRALGLSVATAIAGACLVLGQAVPALASDATVALDDSIQYQTMDGFGTEINATTGTNPSLANMNSTQRNEIYDLLFSKTTGAGLSLLRIEALSGINYSSPGFTIEPTSPGSATSTPTYTWDGSSDDLVEFAAEAQSRGTTGFYLNADSAPAFMKEDGAITGDKHLCGLGVTCASGNWQAAYADYLATYVQYWNGEGIPISWVNPMNEPEYASPYQGMNISAGDAAAFLPVLRTALDSKSLTTKIGCCDSGNITVGNSYAGTILSDPSAAAALDLVTIHGYGDPVVAVAGASALGKQTWMSEFSYINGEEFNTSYTAGADNAQDVSDRIIAALQGGVSGYIDFVGDLDESAGYPFPNQTLIANTSSSTYEVSKRVWAYANYSRYVRPGAVRFDAASSNSNLKAVAFTNTDTSKVVVLNNHNTSATTTTISGPSGGTYSTWVTDDYSNMAAVSSSVSVGSSGSIEVSVPADSTMTVKFEGTEINPPASTCGELAPSSESMSDSPYPGYGADQAFDHNTATYAQANSAVTWDLTADLGANKPVGSVVFTPDSMTYASQYTIQVATAAAPSTWTTVATETAGTGTVKTYDFTPTSARYVKLNVTAQHVDGNWGHAVREFAIFSCGSESGGGALSPIAISSASMDHSPFPGGYGADKTYDGDAASYAQSPDHNWSLTVDLGASHSVSEFVLDPDSMNYAVGYTIQYATAASPTTWTTVATETAGDGSVKTYDFSAVTARYFRVNVTSEHSTGSWGHAIDEVSVLG